MRYFYLVTHEEKHDLIEILSRANWNTRQNALNYVLKASTSVETPKDEKVPTKRTDSQNRSMWLDCELIAKKLQDAGIDWKMVIREGGIDIPVTKESVMEFLWRPVQRVMTGKGSTRDLSKTEGEHGEIHEVVMRRLMEKHRIDWHSFPSNAGLPVLYDEQ